MKILRILLLSIIFSTIAIGQGLMMKDSVASIAAGKTIYKYVSLSNPVPTTLSGGATAANQISANQLGGIYTTTGTTIDSVSTTFTPIQWTFINEGESIDSLIVSSVRTFPTGKRTIRLGHEGFTKPWSFTKLYYKVGTTPLASKKIRIEAE